MVAHERQVAVQAAAGCGVLCACQPVEHPYPSLWWPDAPGSHPITHQVG